jgi:hypothetical protein
VKPGAGHSTPGTGNDADEDPSLPPEPPETVTIPDLHVNEEELEASIRHPLEPPENRLNQLSMPSFRSTPLSEFNRTQPLLS